MKNKLLLRLLWLLADSLPDSSEGLMGCEISNPKKREARDLLSQLEEQMEKEDEK